MSKDTNTSISFSDLQEQIDQFREERDRLNQKTKNYINSLQEIESQINETIKKANLRKKKRNYWNQKVAKLKDKKIEYKEMLNNFFEEKRELQKGKDNKGNFHSVKQVENKIENLERRIETENLKIAEENQIVDQIKELAHQKQKLLEAQNSSELIKKEKQIEIVKINLNKIYEQLEKWSNKSQKNHQMMLDLYDKASELREEKRKIEENLIENKKKADQYHEKFLDAMKKRRKANRGRPQHRGRQKRRSQYRRKSSRKNDKLEKIKQDKLQTALEKQKAGKKLNLFEARLILEQNESD
jgi:uncharacterized coiled-coil DUF342 family protein